MSGKFKIKTASLSFKEPLTLNLEEAGRIRRALPQVLSCSAMNLLLIDLGMAMGFSTILIPVLSGIKNDRNPGETLHFSPTQSSWFGSLIFLTQPLGSLSSGWITDRFGRKYSMIACTMPQVTAWLLLYYANSICYVFIAGVLQGFGVGLMETPVITYVSEICHPSIRGVLLIYSYICTMMGVLFMYILGALVSWRTATLFGLVFPVITAFVLLLVRETPYWLISKGRRSEALASLQWLRGSVTVNAVQEEYNDIEQFMTTVNACDECYTARTPQQCDHTIGYIEKAKDLCRLKFLRPFTIICLSFLVVQFSGHSAIRPFLVQLMKTMRLPIDPNWNSVMMSVTDITANLLCMGLMASTNVGKRPVYLSSLALAMVCALGLSANAFMMIPLNCSSFDQTVPHTDSNNNYIALILFHGLAFGGNVALTVPWMMISEIFPFRVRVTSGGIVTAISYFTVFVSIKTYINLESTLGIAGTFMMYGVLTAIGLSLMYFILPETEGRTLKEIEMYYSDKKWSIFNHQIKKQANDSTKAPKSQNTHM